MIDSMYKRPGSSLMHWCSIAQETNNDLIDSRLADLAKAESQSAERLDDQFGKVLGHLEAHDMLTRTIDENVVAVLSEA